VGGTFRSDRLQARLGKLGTKVLASACFHLERVFGPKIIRSTLRRCRAVLVLNGALPTVLGVPVQYLPQPVYEAELEPHELPNPPKVAYIGYWGTQKGMDELLTAYGELLPRHPSVRFVIAGGAVPGDQTYQREIQTRVAALGSRIELPGFIPPAELSSFIRGSTAIVLPYHPELAGGASAVLMRAQEAGVPLVVSDTPMMLGQVDRENVTVVPSRNAPALTAGISEILTDPERANSAAAREQSRIHLRNGHARVAERLGEILAAAKP
jgi:glycosyltransferase involved in cell wall biosynthesis